MMNATAAENAFIAAINADLSDDINAEIAIVNAKIAAIVEGFNEYLVSTYAQGLSDAVAKDILVYAWEGRSDAGYDVVETTYAEFAAVARASTR